MSAAGKEKDKFGLICQPATGPPLPPAVPGAGLQVGILGASVSPAGIAMVTFTMTDDANVPVTPTTSRTSDPNKARARFYLARLETAAESAVPVPPTFTRYVNYVTSSSSGQPTYEGGGSLALLDSSTGTWVYTYSTVLGPGFMDTLTHTVGMQVQRTYDGDDLSANPLFNFVPDGSPVTVVREPVTTAECNACHNPLALHGGSRREVGLCMLCHTDQPGAVDPDTGNTIDFGSMVHSIHRGKHLPTVENGPVGTKYWIIGYHSSEHIYGEKVQSCDKGPFPTMPCTSDADCGVGGTCTDEKTVGVGYPQDIRNCAKCHTDGATAANHQAAPTTGPCTGCHNDVNPSLVVTAAGPPGTNHAAGPWAESDCRFCHAATGPEFGTSVAGAHTIPLESAQLPGLVAELLTASGAPSGPVTVEFRLTDGGGTPITDLGAADINRVRIVLDGPTSDYAVPEIRATVYGSGSSGVLTGPDPAGVWTYVSAAALPGTASGSWGVAMEARTNYVDLLDPVGGVHTSIREPADNPVLAFSVDGSPLEERREVAATANCASCHGTTAQGFSFHGGSRNEVAFCVFCHNPIMTDFDAREPVVIPDGASPVNEPIGFKHMIHKIHTGEELESKPYIIYGHNSNPYEFSEVLYPGNRADCAKCHVDDSHLLPLPAGVLPTVLSIVSGGSEVVTGSIPPIQDACLACHGSAAAQAHAQSNTAPSGAEGCPVCHAEGRDAPVSEVHAEQLD
jgi:OmcA/MtrC family decaheme c-type cytochrome